jgi:hypothetical protein
MTFEGHNFKVIVFVHIIVLISLVVSILEVMSIFTFNDCIIIVGECFIFKESWHDSQFIKDLTQAIYYLSII